MHHGHHQEIKNSHIKPSYWVSSRNKMNSLLFPFFTQWFAMPGWSLNDTKMFQGNLLENNLFAFPISFALSVNWLWKSSILSFLEKRKRIDLICEHQHPTTSKCCLNHRPADLRTTIQKSERTEKKKKKSQSQSLRLKACHCHLEGEVIVASYQLNKQGNDFNYHSVLPVIFLLIWCAEVTFALPLF